MEVFWRFAENIYSENVLLSNEEHHAFKTFMTSYLGTQSKSKLARQHLFGAF